MKELKQGLLHTFYIFSHPIDGFWIMKSEKKGNLKTAWVLMLLLIITTSLRILSSGYLFETSALSNFSIWLLAVVTAALVFLFTVSNWAVTTLLEGKGSIAEIFMMSMYALTPIIILNVPLLILSHVFVAEEMAFFSFINTVSILWTVFLFLVGNMSVHEYSMTKSIFTIIITLAGMLAIAVLGFLACNLIQRVALWFAALIHEIALRF